MSLLYFALSCYGITSILVYGRVFDRLRPSHHFFHCPMCVGFWVGVILMTLNPFTELFTYTISVTNAFLLGGVGSGVSYVLSMLFGDEGIRHEHRINGSLDTKMDAKTSSKLLQG